MGSDASYSITSNIQHAQTLAEHLKQSLGKADISSWGLLECETNAGGHVVTGSQKYKTGCPE